jgi:hypothetical protein
MYGTGVHACCSGVETMGMMRAMLDAYRDQLRELCRMYGVRRLGLFGSAARADFDPAASDYDFFVDFGNQPVAGALPEAQPHSLGYRRTALSN